MSGYLLDTNSVIYFFNGEEPISKLIKEAENSISISFITKIELLCFETENDIAKKIAEFISEIEVVYISAKSNFLIRSFVSLLKHLIENRRYLRKIIEVA